MKLISTSGTFFEDESVSHVLTAAVMSMQFRNEKTASSDKVPRTVIYRIQYDVW